MQIIYRNKVITARTPYDVLLAMARLDGEQPYDYLVNLRHKLSQHGVVIDISCSARMILNELSLTNVIKEVQDENYQSFSQPDVSL